jgi:hypothetical protein
MQLLLESHVKWAEDKHGEVIIHSRHSGCGTSYIRSSSGKGIWHRLIEMNSNEGPVTEEFLLDGLCREFGDSVDAGVLKRDLAEFLDKLIRQRILRVITDE